MEKYGIKPGNPVILKIEEEIRLTNIISEIVLQKRLVIISYNICADHIHFIIKYEETSLDSIIQLIKSVSTLKYKQSVNKDIVKLWAQKYNRKEIDSEEQLFNTSEYIRNNRLKHGLEENSELEKIVQKFLIPIEKAF